MATVVNWKANAKNERTKSELANKSGALKRNLHEEVRCFGEGPETQKGRRTPWRELQILERLVL